jgi:MFS family permease
VAGPVSYYWARVLLGIAEAGFFPGIIFYLTAWFPAAQRARVVAWFMLAIPVANILGNPVSGLIMDTFKGTAGMAGWQWLFLLEGLPSVALGVLVLFVLPDRPRDAHWLNENEKAALENQIEQEDDQRRAAGGTDKLGAMADPRVWLLVGLYFSVAVGTNATGAYLPKLVKGHFELLLQEQAVAAGRDKEQILWQVGLLAALPHLASVGAMLLTSWLSDRWRVRSLLVAAALMVAGAGWALAWGMENDRMLADGQSLIPGAGWALAWGIESPWIAMGGLCLAQAGMMAVLPVFWALPPLFLGGAAAAAGIALINSVANIGGIFAPRIVGAWGVGPMVAFMAWGTIAAALARVVVEKKQVATSNKEVKDA